MRLSGGTQARAFALKANRPRISVDKAKGLSSRFPLTESHVSFNHLMVVDGVVNQRLTALLLWLTIAAAAIFLFVFEPGKSAFSPICPFRALTGFTCPGCGTTRGLHQLLHGNLAAAFQLNPLLILSLPFLVYALVRYTNTALRGQPIRKNTLQAKYIWALFGIVLFFWVIRNTPLYPFPA